MTRLTPLSFRTLLAAALLLAAWLPAAAQDNTLDGWRPPDLIDAVASFGAAVHDGALYVYGGHVGRVHAHSIENISPGFRRLVLEAGQTWEDLPPGPLLQGTILVSDGISLYRVGGMTATNATAAEPEVLRSSRSAARYDVSARRWEPLPDLPAGRSSHDAVVAGGTLYVVGGWELRGRDREPVWADSVLALDLDGGTAWRKIPAPFERRAGAAGTAGGRIYALGGLRPADGPALRVDVLDTATGEWSAGPDLPEAGRLQGFGVAATSHRGEIFVSQADGKVYRLADSGNAWEQAATLEHPRFMHRLAPLDGYVLGIGGSARGGHVTAIDVVRPDREPEVGSVGQGASRWPGFRGGADANVSRAARLPLTWSDESVTWRASTPGFGQSSPVIWDGIVFLTSIEGALKETLWVSAVSLDDGSQRWRRSFSASEPLEWNDYVSKGAPTPAVDADRLYAFFASGDLLALTHDGETVWHRNLSGDYGSVGGNHGVGNSVLLTERAVVVLLTRRTYSYLLAVAPDTGETLWKADREAGVAWSTPVLTPDGEEIVVSASGRIEGFDPDTGRLLWSFTDLEGNHVPSPTITDDLVIVGGLRVAANLALHRPGTGAPDGGAVAWTASSASSFSSPFAYRDCVFWVNPAGAARCLAPDSGAVRWTHRLPASTWATPLGHGDLVYFFTTRGVTQVLRASAEAPQVVATNQLSVDAPVTGFAAVDDAIVIRAGGDVIRVGRAAD